MLYKYDTETQDYLAITDITEMLRLRKENNWNNSGKKPIFPEGYFVKGLTAGAWYPISELFSETYREETKKRFPSEKFIKAVRDYLIHGHYAMSFSAKSTLMSRVNYAALAAELSSDLEFRSGYYPFTDFQGQVIKVLTALGEDDIFDYIDKQGYRIYGDSVAFAVTKPDEETSKDPKAWLTQYGAYILTQLVLGKHIYIVGSLAPTVEFLREQLRSLAPAD